MAIRWTWDQLSSFLLKSFFSLWFLSWWRLLILMLTWFYFLNWSISAQSWWIFALLHSIHRSISVLGDSWLTLIILILLHFGQHLLMYFVNMWFQLKIITIFPWSIYLFWWFQHLHLKSINILWKSSQSRRSIFLIFWHIIINFISFLLMRLLVVGKRFVSNWLIISILLFWDLWVSFIFIFIIV